MSPKIKKILLWVFIGLLSLGQLQRIELTGNLNSVNIYFHDIFIFFWLACFVFTKRPKFNKIKENLKGFKLETVFIGIATLGIALNLILFKDIISILYLARFLAYILFALSLKHLVESKQLKSRDLRFKFFGAGAIILFLGFIQFLSIKDTRFLAILGWDDHLNRLISTIFDPGFTGIILVISYLYFLSLKKIKSNSLASIIVTLSFFWGIALTFSRATYLALIVSLIALGIIKNKVVTKIFLKIAIFIMMILVIPKPGGEGVDLTRTASIDARKSAVQNKTSALGLKTFLIGNGLFSMQNSLVETEQGSMTSSIPSHSRMPDNFFVNILLSTGAIGTSLMIFILFKWISRASKIDSELGAAILATIVHAQFSNSIFQPFVLLMLLGGMASVKTKSLKLKVKN